MRFLILLIHIILLAPQSQAEISRACSDLWRKPAELFGRRDRVFHSASARLTDLALNDQLIHQEHPLLRREGLLVENGGLCSYVSALYAIHGLHAHHGFPTHGFINEGAAQKVKGLLRLALDFYNHDGRYGSNLDLIAGVINKNIAQGHTGLKLNATHRQFQIREYEILPEKNAVHLVVVNFGVERHTLVILDIDIAHQTLTYLDPHNPSFPRTVSYKMGTTRYGDGVILDYGVGYGLGQIIELLIMRATPSS